VGMNAGTFLTSPQFHWHLTVAIKTSHLNKQLQFISKT